MIKLVIFDLDDTLYNERDFVYSGFIEVSKYLSSKYKIDKNKLYKDMVYILNFQGRGKIFNQICKKYHFKENIEDLVKKYRYNSREISLYYDASIVLKKLKNNYKLGLITDGDKGAQLNKIKLLDLQKYMNKIIITDEYGKEYWKPSIKPFKMILEYFNIDSKESIYIGDNPNKDFIPCKKLGINTVRIIRPIGYYSNTFLNENYEADYNIKSLLELENILEELK
jgi:haloacid dehalogenase superfamily, subfamily IA, variant 1 with third motif having Dx(3-4)D or Dx(3-4)E